MATAIAVKFLRDPWDKMARTTTTPFAQWDKLEYYAEE
jgi:hypothetical protein